MDGEWVSSGSPGLDATIQGLRVGDNVVWQVEDLGDYARFAGLQVARGLAEGWPCVYLRFAPHEALLAPRPGLEVVAIDPGAGFDAFSSRVHRLIAERGRRVLYVFDNLSALVQEWATDESLANFFQVTCPFLRELDTIAYFALTRGRHAYGTVAAIAATTQVLIDLYRVGRALYLHPIKVWLRYSPDMFLPHTAQGEDWAPILAPRSGAAPAGEDFAAWEGPSIAPWDSVYRQLRRLQAGRGGAAQPSAEVMALKTELRRMVMGDDPYLGALADRYLTVEDLLHIRERLIGSGRIGGKAAGMLLARCILRAGEGDADDTDPGAALEEHDSFYVGSDVFFTFLVMNGLFRRRLEVHRQPDLTPEAFAALEQRFLEGRLPAAIIAQFREMLRHYGETPIIVRSSSLFEDGFGHAFAGKYRSEFCANQGSLEERLAAFVAAVKRVYASAVGPDALSYRRNHGLLADCDEQMAILVQRVSGRRHGRLFFPTLAGVAFSRNIYTWSDRLDPRQGLVRLVFGLGTRAVDRVEDYPRMVALSHPLLRPELGRAVARYSQRRVDVIDLAANALRTVPLQEALDAADLPRPDLYLSYISDGTVYESPTSLWPGSSEGTVLTCNKLIRQSGFVPLMRALLARLEAAYGQPVDVEFTADVAADGRVSLDLVQCRPMTLPGSGESVAIPSALSPEAVLFRARRMAGGGVVRDIRYIIYVDPQRYAALGDGELRSQMGRLVGRLNGHPRLRDTGLMMVGPGRWGSSNIALGVNVSYADIDHAAVLVEMARETAGHLPEVSFGTHFFQDLVEDCIIYIPLYPDDPRSAYRDAFFEGAANLLSDLLPDAGDYGPLVKVIDVAASAGGRLAHVVADPEAHEAICYLA